MKITIVSFAVLLSFFTCYAPESENNKDITAVSALDNNNNKDTTSRHRLVKKLSQPESTGDEINAIKKLISRVDTTPNQHRKKATSVILSSSSTIRLLKKNSN